MSGVLVNEFSNIAHRGLPRSEASAKAALACIIHVTIYFNFTDDSYRIVLEPVPNLEHDYINASYIDVRF